MQNNKRIYFTLFIIFISKPHPKSRTTIFVSNLTKMNNTEHKKRAARTVPRIIKRFYKNLQNKTNEFKVSVSK